MTSCNYIDMAMSSVRKLRPYEPGKPIAELQREYGVSEVVKLASNENPLGPSPVAIAELQSGLTELARYPDGNGYDLKQALANHCHCSTGQITLGNGSNDILEFIARAYAGSGDEVIYSQHAFAIYALVTQVVGATGVEVPAKDWGHDLPSIAAAITPNTKLIYLANPNNPTGTCFDKQAFVQFMQQVPEHVLVVLDEAYYEYANHSSLVAEYPDGLKFLADAPNLIVARTFSKAYGLAGLRVGYGIAHEDVTNILNRVRQPFNVNSLALKAAEVALTDHQHLENSIQVNRAGMLQYQAAFDVLGLDWIPSAGNFISVAVGEDAMAVYDALLHKGIIVRPVTGYGMPCHLRISIGLEEENQRAIDALQIVLGK